MERRMYSLLRPIKKKVFSTVEILRPSPQKRLSRSQLAGIIREKKIWIQMAKNLRELEESWTKVVRKNYLFVKGKPKKVTK